MHPRWRLFIPFALAILRRELLWLPKSVVLILPFTHLENGCFFTSLIPTWLLSWLFLLFQLVVLSEEAIWADFGIGNNFRFFRVWLAAFIFLMLQSIGLWNWSSNSALAVPFILEISFLLSPLWYTVQILWWESSFISLGTSS